MTRIRSWRWAHILLLAALLLSAALRFYRLDVQSFWNDEGNAARLAERSIRLIIKGAAADVHPPGYYLLLGAWRSVVGDSEFALRSFSALCGVLTVATAAALGRRAGGRRTAVIAAYSLVVHPLAVYYSQEARMYSLLGLVSAATVLLAAKVWRERATFTSANIGLLFVLILGLYTHYAYVFVLLGVNVVFGVLWLTHCPLQWRKLSIWAGTYILAALAFLPWLPNALRATGWAPPDLNTGQALVEMAHALLTGITLPSDAAPYLLPAAVLLLVLAGTMKSRSSFVKWASLCITLLPLVLIAAFDIYRPAYLKFLMVSVAPLAVLLALSVAPSSRRNRTLTIVTALLLLSLLPAQARSLDHLYFDPAYARDDYRRIAAYVTAEAGPDDAVILSAPNQWEVFTYYYQGPLTVYPAPYHPEIEKADAWIEEILAAKHPQLFLLYWGERESDPYQRLERRLAEQTYKAKELWITDIRLARYATAPLPTSPTVRLDVTLDQTIHLDGYSVENAPFHPGEIIPLTLFWRTEETLDEQLKVFVHVLNDSGALVAQRDTEPVSGFYPVAEWTSGETIIDRYGILLPDDLAPGAYALTTGMYRPNGSRLRAYVNHEDVGDVIPLQTINVTE